MISTSRYGKQETENQTLETQKHAEKLQKFEIQQQLWEPEEHKVLSEQKEEIRVMASTQEQLRALINEVHNRVQHTLKPQ